MIKRLYCFLLLLGSTLFGFSQDEFVFKSVGNEEFQKVLSEKKALLVDVRTAAEFQQGRIADAINIDINHPEFVQLLHEKYNGNPIAIYCRTGRRSKLAKEMLKNSKMIIYELDKGIVWWMQSGNSIRK